MNRTVIPLPEGPYQPTWESLENYQPPAWYVDGKFGIFIHWGVYSVPAYAPVIPGRLAYAEWYWNAMTRGQASARAALFAPISWKYTNECVPLG